MDIDTILDRGHLDLSSPAYPVHISPSQNQWNCTNFHLATWLLLHPDVTQYSLVTKLPVSGAVVMSSARDRYLLFGRQEDRTAFVDWLREYETWFDGRSYTDHIFPPLPVNRTLTATFVPHPDYHFIDQAIGDYKQRECLVVWVDVLSHASGRVWRTRDAFVFEEENDALEFMLRQK